MNEFMDDKNIEYILRVFIIIIIISIISIIFFNHYY